MDAPAPNPLQAVRQELSAFAQRLQGLETKQLAALAASSPAVHFATCVRIFDKNNELVRPKPNVLQLRISAAYEAFQAIGVPLRAVVCKPRQTGGSTFVGHVGALHCKRRRVDGLIVSDKAKNSENLVSRIKEYHAHDRFPWGVNIEAKADSVAFSNGSVMGIDTAENVKAGIGRTRQWFHASEVGKWPKTSIKNDNKVMSAILPSVAKTGPSVVFAESTPEGASGWMYETYDKAVTLDAAIDALAQGNAIPGNGWVKIFAAWFEFIEHDMEYLTGRPVSESDIRAMERSLSDRERAGIQRYGWTWGQVAWRRMIIESECGGEDERMDEYYPEDDVTCWLVSGRPRFNSSCLRAMEDEAKSAPAPEYLKLTDIGNGQVGTAWVRTRGEADCLVWERPMIGHAYILSLDPATGDSQTHGKDPDAHSIQIWRRGYMDENGLKHRHKLVARVLPGCRWDVDVAAVTAMLLSRYYGRCMVMQEVNMGLGFLELFKIMGVPMYEREVIDPNSPNRNEPKRQIGWKLSDKDQRNSLIECLATAIRMGDVEVLCLDWLKQASSFIITDSGKAQARPGAHDDDIMAGAMGIYGLPNATIMVGFVRKRRLPRDWDKWRAPGR